MEGWMKKKTHHLGLWKERYFVLGAPGDPGAGSRDLQYWKWKPRKKINPRGVIALAGCRVFAVDEVFVTILTPPGRFDEELMFDSRQTRDAWLSCLNCALRQYRASLALGGISKQRFLRRKNLWNGEDPADARISSHVHFGLASVRRAELVVKPQQGRMIMTTRRVKQRLSRGGSVVAGVESLEERWLVLVSSRPLTRGFVTATSSSSSTTPANSAEEPGIPLPNDVGLEEQLTALRAHLPFPPSDFWCEAEGAMPLAIETLHIYSQPWDDSPPTMSIVLAKCVVRAMEQWKDGQGWALCLEEQKSYPIARRSPQSSTVASTLDTSVTDDCSSVNEDMEVVAHTWTLVFDTHQACDEWHRALSIACTACRAREEGRVYTASEVLEAYDADPASWFQKACLQWYSLLRKLGPQGISAVAEGESLSLGVEELDAGELLKVDQVSVQELLKACSQFYEVAAAVLEVAVLDPAKQRVDVQQAVVQAVLEPILNCLKVLFMQRGATLASDEVKCCLEWLDSKAYNLQRLGVIHEPMEAVVRGLATRLCLQRGESLRKFSRQLLIRELSPRVGELAQRPLEAPFPVDLFMLVFSCLGLNRGTQAIPLHLGCRRVLKFIVYEVQNVLWNWLLTTQPSISADKVGQQRYISSISSRKSDSPTSDNNACFSFLSARSARYLEMVAILLNGTTAFLARCRDLNEMPALHPEVGSDETDKVWQWRFLPPKSGIWSSAESSVAFMHEEQDDEDEVIVEGCFLKAPSSELLGSNVLPASWSLTSELERFEVLREAGLWTLCDAATLSWRQQALSPRPLALLKTGVCALLAEVLDSPLREISSVLDAETASKVALRVLKVVLASYVLLLARGKLPVVGRLCEQIHHDAAGLSAHFGQFGTTAEKDECTRLIGSVLHDIGDFLVCEGDAGLASRALEDLRKRHLFGKEVLQGLAKHCLSDRRLRQSVLAFIEGLAPMIPARPPQWWGSVAHLCDVLSEKPLPLQEYLGTRVDKFLENFQELPLKCHGVFQSNAPNTPHAPLISQAQMQRASSSSSRSSPTPEVVAEGPEDASPPEDVRVLLGVDLNSPGEQLLGMPQPQEALVHRRTDQLTEARPWQQWQFQRIQQAQFELHAQGGMTHTPRKKTPMAACALPYSGYMGFTMSSERMKTPASSRPNSCTFQRREYLSSTQSSPPQSSMSSTAGLMSPDFLGHLAPEDRAGIQISDAGLYGAFCFIRIRNGRYIRRWVQLLRLEGADGFLEVLNQAPEGSGYASGFNPVVDDAQVSKEALVTLPLSHLRKVLQRNSLAMDMIFEEERPVNPSTPNTPATPGNYANGNVACRPSTAKLRSVRWPLVFDRPGDLKRWLLVLQRWLPAEHKLPLPILLIPERPHLVWDWLPEPLTTVQLQERFDGMWPEVQGELNNALRETSQSRASVAVAWEHVCRGPM